MSTNGSTQEVSVQPTEAQLDTLRHMLGINDPSLKTPIPTRNYAAVEPGNAEFAKLELAGLVTCTRLSSTGMPYNWFECTHEGRAAAMASHKTIRYSRAKRVYLRFLGMRDVFQDLTFKDFLTNAKFRKERAEA